MGENEKLIGEAIAGRRDEVVLATSSASSWIRRPADQRAWTARPATSALQSMDRWPVWASTMSICTTSTA
jgi:aryl-alcohol dehydrogenase-like predicted oxidoreductase